MSCSHLGETIDIHTGGRDLIFPHHENEIAQSEGASGKQFVRYWMHNGFVNVDSEKMSKSLGNFFSIRDVLKLYHPQVLRYFLLTTHYLHPINFSDKNLDDATRRVMAIYDKLAAADEVIERRGKELQGDEPEVVVQARAALMESLTDDFNTPRALATFSDVVKLLNAALAKPSKHLDEIRSARAFFDEVGVVMGLFQHDPVEVIDSIIEGLRKRLFPDGSEQLKKVESMVAERAEARSARDWQRSDGLRDTLLEMGVEVRDTREGTVWRPRMGDSGA